MASEDHLMVAAIDFGTTYSGYAFSWRHDYLKNPLKIQTNTAWNAGGRQLMSLKAPTCVLLNKQKELESFGYEAENRYTDIVIDGEQNDYYYFHRFKMNLHKNENISTAMVLEDVTGKLVPAVTVFSASIKALKNHLIDHLSSKGTGVKPEEIFWVLTVPAIWNDKAKQFMRISAEEAGISKENLIIALEPEAASVYCHFLPPEELHGPGQSVMSKAGTKYMVLDIGGGTLDITVHEMLPNGKLKELTGATGNDCGGTSVDGKFIQLLVKIFGMPLLTDLQNKYPDSYLDLQRNFESVKRTVNSNKTGKVNIAIPYATMDKLCKSHFLGEELTDVVAASTSSNIIKVHNDRFRVDPAAVKNLFEPTIDGIVDYVKHVLKKQEVELVSHLLVVGGFAECSLVQESLRKQFKEKIVIIPDESDLVVLKGAVLFGHEPDKYIQFRVMLHTYGVRITLPFDDMIHDKKHLITRDGNQICGHIFKQLVHIGETVQAGTIKTISLGLTRKFQKTMILPIYTTQAYTAKYIEEEGCTLLGKTELKFTTPMETRVVDIYFIFGNTELSLKAIDRNSSDTVEAQFSLI